MTKKEDSSSEDSFHDNRVPTMQDLKEYSNSMIDLPKPTPSDLDLGCDLDLDPGSDLDRSMQATLLWDLITDDNVPFAVIAGVLGIFIFLSVIFTIWLFFRRKERYQHFGFRDNRLPDNFHDDGLSRLPDHFDKHSEEDVVREECENYILTGVSVPLIQESTKV